MSVFVKRFDEYTIFFASILVLSVISLNVSILEQNKTKETGNSFSKLFIHFFICDKTGKGNQFSRGRPPNEGVVNQRCY